MELDYIETAGHRVSEVISDGTAVRTTQDALDLIGTAGYEGASHVILRESQLVPAFFDLKSGLAGEILQKFTNYRMSLVIVGAFDAIESESLRAFVRESNRGGRIAFVADRKAALAWIAGPPTPGPGADDPPPHFIRGEDD